MIIKTKPYKGIELIFDEDGEINPKRKHQFYANEKPVISVTKATGKLDKSNALIPWAIKLFREFLYEQRRKGIEITEEIILEGSKLHTIRKEEAGDIGTQIHDWIELWIKGKDPKEPEDEKIKNGALAFMKWRDEHKVKFLKSEECIYSKKYKFAGILDAEAKIGGELAIVDFKSGNGLYNDMRYQVAGYRLAKEEMTGKKYDVSWLIRFTKEDKKDKKGNIVEEAGSFHAYRLEDYPKDLKAFLGLLTTAKREEELKDTKQNESK